MLKGKPLLQWAVEAAKGAKKVGEVYVSTDSIDYANLAIGWGAYSVSRPPLLAEDVPTEDVILDALDKIRGVRQWMVIDAIVIIQCTTPLVTSGDIDAAIGVYETGFYGSVISVTLCREQPAWMFQMEGKNLVPFIKGTKLKGEWGVRQTLKPLYRPNGAVYVTSQANISRGQIINYPIGYYLMDQARSWDVDEELDLKILEALAP